MAESKKYWYIQLNVNFFEDERIDWLCEQKNGYAYVVLYLKLCLKTANNNGILTRQVGDMIIPYNIDKIAEITHMDVDVVRVAFGLYKAIGLIYEADQNCNFMRLPEVPEMVGYTTQAAIEKAKQRERKKLIEAGQIPDKCPDNVLQELRVKSKELRVKSNTDTSVPDYEQIRNLFVEICKDLPQPNSVKTWTPARKKTISSANMDLPEWERLFKAVAESDFLCGKKTDWKASFDWIIKPANRQKILEGTYRNTQKPKSNGNPSGPTSYNIEEFESALLEDMMGGYDAEK